MEAAALDSAIHMLSRLALPMVREFLETSDIPPDCLAAIERFSVEDFDGLEDISVKSTEAISGTQFRLEYYFNIRALIWTIEVDDAFAQANATRLDEIFFNRRTESGVTKMDIIQHRCFRGSVTFDRDAETFYDASISLSAMRPARTARQ